MHMNVIYFVCTAFKDLLDHNTIDSWSVDIGFLRFFKSISTLEVDLPCATSLATMLMSYALVDLQIIDANTAVTCPKPRRFIKADSQGKLYATDGVSEPECSEINYFTYDLPDSTM
ncbi:hypothetical protein OESDEN_06733 [Oesophagostomum dentatum]|uniref:Uncharacterized protein n=1 Tax=Oesophagostomum dentatum TaxID=61180 RepID=A0A0B1S2Q1_OESDE|nr:hypothetical protein OESDEN_21151 [Oesophagostomum dentatum]KHJ93357.1 hypothetical protein OESDEN_06733 [Oesophagostomum dentatum]